MSGRSRATLLRALAALLFGALTVIAPATAADASSPGIGLSVNGAAFGASSDGPLLDVDGLSPGGSTSATLGVRSGLPDLSALYLRLHDVRDDDNGCVGAERAVDRTCGAGQGDLGRSLRFTIAVASRPAGPYRTTWTGSADRLTSAVAAGARLQPGDERWVRFSAALPAGTGALVESDSFEFGLTVSLVGSSRSAHVEAISAHRTGAHRGAGFGADSATTSVLASTGFAVSLYVAAGVLFLGAGGCVVLTTRRRRIGSR